MSNQSKGRVIIISGFSGTGKGTVVDKILKDYPDKYILSISATSRAPRPVKETGRLETEGVHYFFKTREQFEQMIAEDALMEYAEYSGNYYGTPKAFAIQNMNEGRNVILEIEQQGAFKVKEKYPDVLLIFLAPPSIEELERRLRGRKSNTEEEIVARMQAAARESKNIGRYDYIVINDDLDECVKRIDALIDAEAQRVCYKNEFIDTLRYDLEKYR